MHEPISYRFRDGRRFQSKIAKFSHSLVFCVRVPTEGVPLELRTRAGIKKSRWATGPTKKFDDIFSHVETMHQRDRQTDGQTPGDSNVRAYA